jgi:hypothetical protein
MVTGGMMTKVEELLKTWQYDCETDLRGADASGAVMLSTCVAELEAAIEADAEHTEALVVRLRSALLAVTDCLEDQRDIFLGNGYPEDYAAIDEARAVLADDPKKEKR